MDVGLHDRLTDRRDEEHDRHDGEERGVAETGADRDEPARSPVGSYSGATRTTQRNHLPQRGPSPAPVSYTGRRRDVNGSDGGGRRPVAVGVHRPVSGDDGPLAASRADERPPRCAPARDHQRLVRGHRDADFGPTNLTGQSACWINRRPVDPRVRPANPPRPRVATMTSWAVPLCCTSDRAGCRARPRCARSCPGSARPTRRAARPARAPPRRASDPPASGRVRTARLALPPVAPSVGWRSRPRPGAGSLPALRSQRLLDPPQVTGHRCRPNTSRSQTQAALSSSKTSRPASSSHRLGVGVAPRGDATLWPGPQRRTCGRSRAG